MYDELSLQMLLAAGGFREHRRQDHRSSMIPDWNRYALDQSTRGTHAIEPSRVCRGEEAIVDRACSMPRILVAC
jgi:hypothetical protein